MKISSYYYSKKKIIFDFILATTSLVILAPLMLTIALFIYLQDHQVVIFTQKRLGKNKTKFDIYKFRTMKLNSAKLQEKLQTLNQAPYPMFKIKNDPRFTKLGKILSKLGLDELPQLINILKGEMSFVGPRPLPVTEAKKLDQSWNFRYQVRPGIMSKWAISRERYLSLQHWQKLEQLDLLNASIATDIKIILKTIRVVLIQQIAHSFKALNSKGK